MARRETERDTYGGERRWSEGAGVSWAVDKTGPEHPEQVHRGDSEPVLWRGSEASASTSGGILRQLSDELGITDPAAAEPRSDEQIREDVCERLWRDPRVNASEVSVDVQGAIVTLQGTVAHREMKHEIEDIVASCEGVKDVDNRIRLTR
jgi:hypothetical protein